jgi:hypothetical protein
MARLPLCLSLASTVWLAACSCQPDNSINVIEPEETNGLATHDIGQYLSMAVTSDDQPAISFYDRDIGALAFALGKINDDTIDWSIVKVDGYPDEVGLDPGDRGKYTSLAIDSEDRTWIAYHDATTGVLRVATCPDGGTAWELLVGDTGTGASPVTGKFASLALDPTGSPVIAHYQSDKQVLRISHWDGTGFTGETIDEGDDYTPQDTGEQAIDANVGKYANLAIGSDGTEYIAYYDAAYGDLKLATGTAGSYTITTIDSAGDVGAWPDILLNGDELIISYQDVGNQDLKMARGAGSTWTLETIDEGRYVGADSAIFMNGSYPGVWYFDGHDNNVKLAQQAGSDWSADNWAGDEAALGYHLETVTIGTTVWVASYDYTNRNIWVDSL